MEARVSLNDTSRVSWRYDLNAGDLLHARTVEPLAPRNYFGGDGGW